MADPITIGLIVGGGVLQGFAGYQNAKYQQAVGEYNATAMRGKAAYDRSKALADKEELRRKQARARAGTVRSMAFSGVDLGSVTTSQVLAMFDSDADYDLRKTIHAGEVSAWESEFQAGVFDSQAKSAGSSAIMAGVTPIISAAGTAVMFSAIPGSALQDPFKTANAPTWLAKVKG